MQQQTTVPHTSTAYRNSPANVAGPSGTSSGVFPVCVTGAGLTEWLSSIRLRPAVDIGASQDMISTQNTLRKYRGGLTLVNVSHDPVRLFQLMRLDKHFMVTAQDHA